VPAELTRKDCLSTLINVRGRSAAGLRRIRVAVSKNTQLTKRLNLQLRFEFYNLFDHENLYLENDLASGGFGKAISQQLPRWCQVGARLTF
jgi:hypothetical protein